MDKVYVDLCVNHPDNGVHTGYVDAIRMHARGSFDALVYLNGGRLRCRRSPDGKQIKIGREWYPITVYAAWVGNWCWDSTGFKTEDAVRLLGYLQKHGWLCEEGVSDLFDKWRAGQPITVEDFRNAAQGDEA